MTTTPKASRLIVERNDAMTPRDTVPSGVGNGTGRWAVLPRRGMTRMTDWPLHESGIWLSIGTRRHEQPTAALFLDRDGVVVEDVGFLRRPDDVRLIDGIAGLIAEANRRDVPVLVATNQSGIARGLLDWAVFASVENRIADLLHRAGARIDAVAACPFHPEFTPGYGPEQARWRKPEPAMIELLGERLNIDIARSWMIGDRERDIAAARAAGLAGGILLHPPSEGTGPAGRPDADRFMRITCENVGSARAVLAKPLHLGRAKDG